MKLSSTKRRRYVEQKGGAIPGQIYVDPNAPKPAIRVMGYNADRYEEHEIETVSALRSLVEQADWSVVWVNVDGLGDAETLRGIGATFDLHPLALEDVAHVSQRPKVDQYGEHLFIVTRMVTQPDDEIINEQVSLFLGKNFVLTFQERPGDCLDPVRDRIREDMGRIRKSPADYLAYSLLDAVIDGYFPVLETFGERLESLESEVIRKPNVEVVRRIHRAKRDLLAIRRAIWPQRESVNSLLREGLAQISPATQPYMKDCYDHVIQLIDMVETYREIASGLLEAYMTNVSNRMNEVMKVLTIIATIFIPLSFLAGVWGMNFNHDASDYNMPELRSRYGYPIALCVMGGIGLFMLFLFWRKGWLGGRNDGRDDD